MKKLSISLTIISISFILAATAFSGQAGNSSVGQWYLFPDQDGCTPIYEDAIAKLQFNGESGDFVLKGHGLEAGKEFELRSNGSFDYPATSIAVGNGTPGRGNNLLIKGNIFDFGYDCEDLGARWNLWVDTDGNGNWVRVLRSPADDPPVCY
ncbi:hypothetical protein N9893_03375 [bacterium]|nr:hypothetical protein [bacterium]